MPRGLWMRRCTPCFEQNAGVYSGLSNIVEAHGRKGRVDRQKPALPGGDATAATRRPADRQGAVGAKKKRMQGAEGLRSTQTARTHTYFTPNQACSGQAQVSQVHLLLPASHAAACPLQLAFRSPFFARKQIHQMPVYPPDW